MTEPELALELDAERMRALVDAAMDRIVAFEAARPDAPGEDMADVDAVVQALLEPDLPEHGADPEDLLDTVFDVAAPKAIHAGGAQQLSYIPGSGIFHSAVADLVSNSLNRFTGTSFAAPALVQLETNVIRWFCDLMGYDQGAGGFLTPGGSTANLYGLITARTETLGEDFLDGVVYTSDQAHHSVTRSATLAGFRADHVRSVPSDDRFRIDVDALEIMIDEDVDAGRRPAIVVANAGSTNTGAVDDLNTLAGTCRGHGMWLHADAAYGGFFVLTERGRARLDGLGRADSITLDPHKGLFLPYGTGGLLVRDMATLERTHQADAAYLLDPIEGGPIDFSRISPELTRDFRGLRVWLPLKMHGAAVFRRCLDEKLDLARWAHEQLQDVPDVRTVCEPELSTFAFRVEPDGASPEEADELSRRLIGLVNDRGRVHVSGTTTKGRYLARISVLSFRTHMDRMEMAVEDIAAAVEELVAKR